MKKHKEYIYTKLPHPLYKKRFNCGCCACEAYRSERVEIGSLVKPAMTETNYGVPFWRRNDWENTGWSMRITDIHKGIVIGAIPSGEKSSGAHLDCVIVYFATKGVFVTSRKWLVVLDK